MRGPGYPGAIVAEPSNAAAVVSMPAAVGKAAAVVHSFHHSPHQENWLLEVVRLSAVAAFDCDSPQDVALSLFELAPRLDLDDVFVPSWRFAGVYSSGDAAFAVAVASEGSLLGLEPGPGLEHSSEAVVVVIFHCAHYFHLQLHLEDAVVSYCWYLRRRSKLAAEQQ